MQIFIVKAIRCFDPFPLRDIVCLYFKKNCDILLRGGTRGQRPPNNFQKNEDAFENNYNKRKLGAMATRFVAGSRSEETKWGKLTLFDL